MSTRGQLIILWTTPVAGALFLFAYFMFPAFSPVMSPTMSPEEVAEFFRENLAAMRGVVIMCNIIAASLVPIFATTLVQMLRIVNSSSVFAYSYLMAVVMGLTSFILADYCWGVALFRPDRDPQLISLLNDMAWLFFIASAGPIIAQCLCFAGAIYLDERPEPVFPRWVAHFNILIAILIVPSAFAILFKTGPLAWDGFLSFDLRLFTYAVYVAVMFFVLLRVIHRQVETEGVVA